MKDYTITELKRLDEADKSMKAFAIKAPEGAVWPDDIALWMRDYLAQEYKADAVTVYMRMVPLKFDGTRYRTLRFDNGKGMQLPVEMAYHDMVKTEGSPYKVCPYHLQVYMDQEAVDRGALDDLSKELDILTAQKGEYVMDLTDIWPFESEKAECLTQTDVTIKCPDQYLAHEIMDLIEAYVNPPEDILDGILDDDDDDDDCDGLPEELP